MRSHNLAWFWICISVPLESRWYFFANWLGHHLFSGQLSVILQSRTKSPDLSVLGVAQHEGISQNGPLGCLALYVFCSRCVLDVYFRVFSLMKLGVLARTALCIWCITTSLTSFRSCIPEELKFLSSWKKLMRGIWSVLLCLEYRGFFFFFFIFCSYSGHKVFMQSEPLCEAFLTWVSLNWFIQLRILNRHLFSNSEWHMTHSCFRSVVYALRTDIVIEILSC